MKFINDIKQKINNFTMNDTPTNRVLVLGLFMVTIFTICGGILYSSENLAAYSKGKTLDNPNNYMTIRITKDIKFDNKLYDKILHNYNNEKTKNSKEFQSVQKHLKINSLATNTRYPEYDIFFTIGTKNKLPYYVNAVTFSDKIKEPTLKLNIGGHTTQKINHKPINYITIQLPK